MRHDRRNGRNQIRFDVAPEPFAHVHLPFGTRTITLRIVKHRGLPPGMRRFVVHVATDLAIIDVELLALGAGEPVWASASTTCAT